MQPDSEKITPNVNLRRDTSRLLLTIPRERRHLTGFLLAALALLLLVAAPAYTNYRSSIIRSQLDEQVEPLNMAVRKMQELVLKERIAVSDLLAAGDEAIEAEQLALWRGEDAEAYSNFELTELARYQALEQELLETIDAAAPIAHSLGEETSDLFEETVSFSDDYRQYLHQYLSLYQAGRTEEARLALATGGSLDSFGEFSRTSDALFLYTDNMRAAMQGQLAELNMHGFYLAIPLVLIGLILLFYVLLLLTSSMTLLNETHRQKLEIERQREQLEKANHTKDAFLGVLSHELRTPLTPILGWTAILKKKTDKNSELAQAVDVIERCAKTQAQLIDDLLDLSNINNKKLKIDRSLIDLNDCVSTAVKIIQPTAEAKGIKILQDLSPRKIFVNADQLRIQQSVWNLLSNAIKYNFPGGQIFIKTRIEGKQAEVSVSDSGIGIKPELINDIFGMFKQADSSITRRHGGLGIGLAIVKSLVEAHDGEVIASSDGEGKGSSFIIKLPLADILSRPANAA
jgi:signal transduction histidine kinase